MSPPFQPLQLLLVIFAEWVNRHQLEVIAYLQEENRVLTERLGGRRIRFTDIERCRLARKAHTLGRKVLSELHTLVTPHFQHCFVEFTSLRISAPGEICRNSAEKPSELRIGMRTCD